MALPPDVFVPVPLRWRHVVSGDVIVGKDGALWIVGDNELPRGGVQVRARQGGDRFFVRDVDPDATVKVLISATERDALRLTREQMGAQVVERREATASERELAAPPEVAA